MDLSVIVLCGGKGIRLRPITKSIPKPLVKIKNKPILKFIIEHLIKNNVRDINFAVGYKSAIIKNYINSLNILKKINYSIIDSGDVDIIKRISKITNYLDKDVLIIYGDTYTDINISNLIKFHKKNKLPASVVSIPFKTNFGLFKISKKNVVFKYKEKPILDEYINIGYFVFNKNLFKILNRFKKFESLLLFLIKNKKINAYKFKGLHITFNTIGELVEIENKVQKLK